MPDQSKNSWEPHWIVYWIPLVAILLWMNYSSEQRAAQQREMDKICNSDCRYEKRLREIDAEMRRVLTPSEYESLKADERKIDREMLDQERRRSYLTEEERRMLEQAEWREYN